MWERPEPRLIRARTFVLLLLSACIVGGGIAEMRNAFAELPRAAAQVSR